jgi:hypothetical protein
MSDDWGFSSPPFRPEEALIQLRRSLRDCKLAERSNAFELRGKCVVELEIDAAATAIQARVARRLVSAPEWDRLALRSAADQRKLVDEVKRRLARWEQEE